MDLDFHQILICKMKKSAWISVLKSAASKKFKGINEVAEKLRTAAKKQENQVSISVLNQGEWALLETCKKYAIDDRYYQMSIIQREKILRRFNEANVSVIYTKIVTFLPQVYLFLYQNVVLYISLLKFLMKCLFLLESSSRSGARIRRIFSKIKIKS